MVGSCLRSAQTRGAQRTVSFPQDSGKLVTGYLDPPNPWQYAESCDKEVVISNYKESCEKHGTKPIESILQQLEKLEMGKERSECLDLKGEFLLTESCEALEEILKRIQFIKINLEATSLNDEAAVVMFDMIEYYEAATHLNISSNNEIMVRGWQACQRMLKKTKCLEELELRNTSLTETYMSTLSKSLRLGAQLQVLRLENCALAGTPLLVLVAALKLNVCLKELYLGENYLSVHDAIQLAALLKCNSTLQLLDISNNKIEDKGLSQICDGMVEQASPGGLSILIVWNNHLTSASALFLSTLLTECTRLEMLNVGHNDLGNEFVFEMKDSLLVNRCLLRLGIQSTGITSEGAIALAEVIAENPTLQRIDLRENRIEVSGLTALSHSIKLNSALTQIDLDDKPTSGDELSRWIELVSEVRSYCKENSGGGEEEKSGGEGGEGGSRKISLTCDTLSTKTGGLLTANTGGLRMAGRLRSPAPSPIPSPVASPSPTRTRFQVCKVSEDSASGEGQVFFGSSSRFKVTVVEAATPPPTPPSASHSIPHFEKKEEVVEERVEEEKKGDGGKESGGRSRKLSSWVAPNIFTESKAVEKLLGLFQNPFSRVGGGSGGGGAGGGGPTPPLNNNEASHDCNPGATWPLRLLSPPHHASSATSAPSLLPYSPELRTRSQSSEGVDSSASFPLAL